MSEHRKPKHQPKHAKPKQCGHSWTEKGPFPHDDHTCGNDYGHGGKHLCNDWNCSASQ